MNKFKKGLILVLALCMALSIFAGCADSNQNANNSPSPSPSASTPATPSASASAGTETKTLKELNAEKEKVTINWMMTSSGITAPETVDLNDNFVVDWLEEYANVDLVVDQPPYADYNDKLILRISGGDLPDLIHAIGTAQSTDMPEAAVDGAVLELSEYYQNSVNVKQHITEEHLNWCKNAEDGKTYYIPMNHQAIKGTWLMVRGDVIDKYNDGVMPTSLDEWVTFWEKYHEEAPDAIPLSNRLNKSGYALIYGGRPVFAMYGLGAYFGNEWDYDNQKVISELLTPEYKAAATLLRDLYSKGILDKEFGTTENWWINIATKGTMIQCNSMDQIYYTDPIANKIEEDPTTETLPYWTAGALFTEWPEEVRYPEVAYGTRSTGYTGHGMWIASTAANPDRCWDVIEALADPEFEVLCQWGIEGKHYTVEGDEKVPVLEYATGGDKAGSADSAWWARQFMMIQGMNNADTFLEYSKAVARAVNTDKEFVGKLEEAIEPVAAASQEVALTPMSIPGFIASDDATRKSSEANTKASTLTIEYIMGTMSEADFDAAIEEWKNEYGFIAQERTDYIASYDKAAAEALGIKYTLD